MRFPKIILASKSPRRKQILEMAEIEFEICEVHTDESYPSNLTIEDIPIFIAEQKADSVRKQFPNSIIISADTIVMIDKMILGKPKDREDALMSLKILSGKIHQVITGVCIRKEELKISFSETTEVEFCPLTLEQIEYYVDHFRPYDKAGAYAIQEWIGAVGVKKINGCYYNVMGLPISKLIQNLNEYFGN